MTMGDNNGILLEEVRHMFLAIREGQESMASVPGDMAIMRDDIALIQSDIKAIKAIAKSHSIQLDNHEARITTLETA